MICDTILDAVGNTPLIRLHRMTQPGDAEVLVKFEGLEVGGSIKTRTALKMIERAEKEGLIDKVLTTNLVYQMPELLEKPYYISCDMSKYIAYIIDTLNHDTSISDLLNPFERIHNLVNRYNAGEV